MYEFHTKPGESYTSNLSNVFSNGVYTHTSEELGDEIACSQQSSALLSQNVVYNFSKDSHRKNRKNSVHSPNIYTLPSSKLTSAFAVVV